MGQWDGAVEQVMRGMVRSDDGDLYCERTVRVADGATTRELRDPLGMVRPVSRTSRSRQVTRWELAGHLLELGNRLRAVPEARRRAVHRRERRRQVAAIPPCPACGGSGWIDDAVEGRGYDCPTCQVR